MSDPIEHLIKAEAIRLGFDLVGIASADPPRTMEFLKEWIAAGMHAEMDYMERSLPLRSDLTTVLPGVRSVIAVGLNYNQPLPEQETRIARYALGRDYHKVLRGKLRALARYGGSSVEGSKWRACVDSAPVLERELANRAGIGWFGKNTCLIDSQRGSWFFIGILLTTAALIPDAPAVGGCGTCRACIDACPTGAIVMLGDRWTVDSRRCISYLTIEKRGEFSPAESEMIGAWTFGCDICQEVCPFNQPRPNQPLRAQPTQEPDFANLRDWPDLDQLRVLNPQQWERLTEGSAIRRTGIEGIRRNAEANLRNRGKDRRDR